MYGYVGIDVVGDHEHEDINFLRETFVCVLQNYIK
jgi:hypothetical protein